MATRVPIMPCPTMCAETKTKPPAVHELLCALDDLRASVAHLTNGHHLLAAQLLAGNADRGGLDFLTGAVRDRIELIVAAVDDMIEMAEAVQ